MPPDIGRFCIFIIMNAEEIRIYALSKNDVTESFPFGEEILVFKVNNKMFLLIALNEVPLSYNVKCDPEKAITLREDFEEAILPGFHMNKKHWNTVISEKLKESLNMKMIDDSYNLVKKK